MICCQLDLLTTLGGLGWSHGVKYQLCGSHQGKDTLTGLRCSRKLGQRSLETLKPLKREIKQRFSRQSRKPQWCTSTMRKCGQGQVCLKQSFGSCSQRLRKRSTSW